jgi:hypothetical protein
MTDLVQRLRRMCGDDPNTIVTQAADRIEKLERENAELRKDAERMQWIVDNDVGACHLLRTTSGTFIRREIDEAMKS